MIEITPVEMFTCGPAATVAPIVFSALMGMSAARKAKKAQRASQAELARQKTLLEAGLAKAQPGAPGVQKAGRRVASLYGQGGRASTITGGRFGAAEDVERRTLLGG